MRSSYSDPTANTAIANVDRERRREEKRKKMLDNQEKKRHLQELETNIHRSLQAKKQ